MLDGLIRQMKADRDWVATAAAQDVLAEARARSSSAMPADLAKTAPYAKRHGSPRGPMDRIHADTGLFLSSWKITQQASGAPKIENDAPYAPFLEDGTWKMFGRPLEELQEFAAMATERRLIERLG